ncbi:hypothetical protein GCM10017044_10100 [Kordiimonas sediminis]|uniref:Uncharacterized protein n=1 Tax=Kordiimonas sediminis TaxID=1735581 RepID=A0A919ANF9_9PROT|nr:hypothetical protein [Kordiimonas sediminis]GHF17673.1 hypothetical protein GCM10017044_10100 [Kordiimonas sediminis]
MTDQENKAPEGTGKKQKERLKDADKQARLAEALRANLRRRKSQARDRKDTGEDDL